MSRTKTILKSIPYAAVALAATAAVIAPLAVSAWGPDRDIYCIKGSPIACPVSNPAGEVADRVVFNSIANNPAHGDERNFMQIKEHGASDSTYTDSIVLQPGKTYDVFMYYHNNASSSLNASGVGIATGTNIRAAIPALVGNTDTKAVGYIKSNQSAQVWDDITVKSANDGKIALSLVSGSAKLYNRNDGNGNATKVTTLSDKIVTAEGAAIGYNLDSNGNVKLDGVIPGCNEFSGYVVFQIVADQANFTVDKEVRLNNDGKAQGGWVENVNAKKGDIVDFLIEYKNTGTVQQNDVVIKDVLPAGLEYIKNSTVLYNGSHTTDNGGLKVADGVTSSTGINIGNYAPGANALVKFSAKVTSNDCSTAKNIAHAITANGSRSDDASVKFDNDCTPVKETCDIPGKTHLPKDDPACKETVIEMCTTPGKTHLKKDDPACYDLPVTGTGSLIPSIIGVGSLATAGAYFVRSRKNRN